MKQFCRLQARFDGDGLKFHVKCATEFKTCYRLWFGPLKSLVVLCHPDTIKVIQSSNAPKERFVYNLVRPFIGESSFVEQALSSPQRLIGGSGEGRIRWSK